MPDTQPNPQHNYQFSFDRMPALTGKNTALTCSNACAYRRIRRREASMRSRNGTGILANPDARLLCPGLLKLGMA